MIVVVRRSSLRSVDSVVVDEDVVEGLVVDEDVVEGLVVDVVVEGFDVDGFAVGFDVDDAEPLIRASSSLLWLTVTVRSSRRFSC